MKKNDEDLRKDIENLEKLIEQVKTQNREELDKLKKEAKPGARRPTAIRIDLAADYAPSLTTNLVVGFLVNFILFVVLFGLIGLAEADSVWVYAGLSAAFTVYEILIRRYLFRRQMKLVMYSSGLVFFLLHLVFFYAADLLVLPTQFSFYNLWYPMVGVASFTMIRFLVRLAYIGAVRRLSGRGTPKS